jgi:integrase
MNDSPKLPGTIYLNGSRYWWRVKLPGTFKMVQIRLKFKGGKFATRNLKDAEMLAAEIWQDHIQKQKWQKNWDGKLVTLILMYNRRNENYYLPPSNEAKEILNALNPLAHLYPDRMADDFTPLDLKQYREYLIGSGKFDLCRKTINTKVGIITRMFKWAVSECLISIHTFTALTTVEGLRKGRTTVREGRTISPAKIEIINAAMPYMTPVVSDMIQVQLLSGMRPGELVRMRPCDIEKHETVWIYRPATHKTAWHGHTRAIPLGTKAQAILAKYLIRPPDDYCFKPAESDAQALQRKHEARITPLGCGNRPGSNSKGTKPYNDRFNTSSYRRHITRACIKAGVEPWFPHQLRHTAATDIRREFGLDAARAVLGHKSVVITNEYAELDLEKASAVAKAIG